MCVVYALLSTLKRAKQNGELYSRSASVSVCTYKFFIALQLLLKLSWIDIDEYRDRKKGKRGDIKNVLFYKESCCSMVKLLKSLF